MYMYVYNFKIHYLPMKIQIREFFVFDVVFAHNYQASVEDVFLNIFCSGGGPCSEEVSTISQKACGILGEDSPTIWGIDGGLDTDEVQLESFSLNNRRWQTEESEDEDASLTSKKPRYDHDFILMNV